MQWRITHESTYQQYLQSLSPKEDLYNSIKAYKKVGYSDSFWVEVLAGRNDSAIVRRRVSPDTHYVYKGLAFATFLLMPEDISHRVNDLYREIRTTRPLPRHANIIPPAEILVTTENIPDNGESLVCGILYPSKNGSLEAQIETAIKSAARLALRDIVRWRFQMASAVAHTHLAAHTYHMDIKPANFLLNDNRDLLLID